MSKKPKVSVLTPVYNTNCKYLQEMIESVLTQTYTDFEFILLNDSPDNTELERKILSYNDPRIHYIKNECNMGISESRNKLLTLAQGEYIAILDHDDICLPDRLEKEVIYLDNHPEIGVVSGNITFFPDDPHTTNYPQDNLDIKLALLKGCYVVHTAAMLRKSILEENNIQYEKAFSPAEDYRLWIRLINITMFHNLPDVLVNYRNYSTNTTHLQLKRMLDQTMRILNWAYKEYPYLSAQLDTNKGTTVHWYYLLAFIPFIKKVSQAHKSKYYLFGFLPILKRKVTSN